MEAEDNLNETVFDANDRFWLRVIEWLLLETFSNDDSVGSRLLLAKMHSLVSAKFCTPDALLSELKHPQNRPAESLTQRERIVELNCLFADFEIYLRYWAGADTRRHRKEFCDQTWQIFTRLKMRFFF